MTGPAPASALHPSPTDGPFVRPPLPERVCAETTPEVLRRAALAVPDLEAVVSGDRRVSYAALLGRVERAQEVLRSIGVRAGDHVALCAGNGPRWVELFYAVTGLGAVVVAVNTRYRQDEIGYVLRHSRSRFLLTEPRILSTDVLGMLPALCGAAAGGDLLPSSDLPDLAEVVVLDEDPADARTLPGGARRWSELAGAQPASTSPRLPTPDDVALVQYTSGTTSRPKGVLLTHRNMCVDAWFSGSRMGLRQGDRFHSVRPFFHVAGSTLSVLSSAQLLATLVTMPRFEPGEALAVLERERCTHFSSNDTIALMLLDHPDRARRQLCLRGAWVAASPPVVRRVIDDLGAVEAVVGYGQSEASPNVAQSAWYEPEDVRVSAAMRPEPGVQVRIWDTVRDTLAPAGARGEIQVLGWNVMRGYFDDAERTREACTRDGWLRTGDLGEADPDGRIRFVGRLKDLIRVGGENVAPAEVEDVLIGHPAIRQAVVVGVPDARLVEVPFAFVVLVDDQQHDVTPEALMEWTRDRLAGFKVPRHLRVVTGFEEIGMTASSKVQKNKLAEHAAALLEGAR